MKLLNVVNWVLKKNFISTVSEIGRVSEWSHWSKCPQRCKRGAITRTRDCYSTMMNTVDNTCGTDKKSTKETKDCLILDDCGGTRYYLGDSGMSCKTFCLQKCKCCFGAFTVSRI